MLFFFHIFANASLLHHIKSFAMNYFDYNSYDEDDNDDTSPATPEESWTQWTQMSPSQAPWESQQDYEDRMKDLDDYGEFDG